MSDEHPTPENLERGDADMLVDEVLEGPPTDDPAQEHAEDEPTPVSEMVPEPPEQGAEQLAIDSIEPETSQEAADDPSLTDQIAAISAEDLAQAEAAEPEADVPDDGVAPLTAADIPALEGCDVEKSWAGDETCEGTEPVTEAVEESVLEPAEGEEALAPEESEEVSESLVLAASPNWPFVIYLVLWAGLSVLAGWQLAQIPPGELIMSTDAYRWTVIGGVIMTVVGPLLVIGVWLAIRARSQDGERDGLLSSALLKGSIVTLLGVIMWWGTLAIVDRLRIGRFF